MIKKPYISYYNENKISPVSQDISDLERHFGRRRRLYERLGLPPAMIKGKTVLEFGPGSGYNSLYTLHLEPAVYSLVDANPWGLETSRNMLTGVNSPNTKLDFILSSINDVAEHRNTREMTPGLLSEYDVVLCEGLLSYQLKPSQTACLASQFTASGGVFVATCSDYVSLIADITRRLLGQAISDPSRSPAENAQALAPYFKSQFQALKGMSRPVTDWILDCVFQPIYGPPLSIADIINALGGGFNILGASPLFFTDWRWYKDLDGHDCAFCEVTVQQYLSQIHNFIDYRVVWPARDMESNMALFEIGRHFFNICLSYQESRDPAELLKARDLLTAVADNIASIGGSAATETSLGYLDGGHALYLAAQGDPKPDTGRFNGIFGRGQQYISFVCH